MATARVNTGVSMMVAAHTLAGYIGATTASESHTSERESDASERESDEGTRVAEPTQPVHNAGARAAVATGRKCGAKCNTAHENLELCYYAVYFNAEDQDVRASEWRNVVERMDKRQYFQREAFSEFGVDSAFYHRCLFFSDW